MQPVVPPITESPGDAVATTPSISHLPPTPLHYTPSPEMLKTRSPRFWSRIESTTVGPHGGGFDEVYNPTNYKHDEQPPVEMYNYPDLPNTQDQRNQFRDLQSNPSELSPNQNPPLGGPWSWGNREGSSVHPPAPFYPEYPVNMEDLSSNQDMLRGDDHVQTPDLLTEQQQDEVSTPFQ